MSYTHKTGYLEKGGKNLSKLTIADIFLIGLQRAMVQSRQSGKTNLSIRASKGISLSLLSTVSS
jgi:hypothetical protein